MTRNPPFPLSLTKSSFAPRSETGFVAPRLRLCVPTRRFGRAGFQPRRESQRLSTPLAAEATNVQFSHRLFYFVCRPEGRRHNCEPSNDPNSPQ